MHKLTIKCTNVNKIIQDAADNFKKANKDAKVTADVYRAGITWRAKLDISMDLLDGDVLAIMNFITERRRKQWEQLHKKEDQHGCNDDQSESS